MASVDLDNLDHYVVVLAKPGKKLDTKKVRALNLELEPGVTALWSDEAKSIQAFVFDPGRWDQEKAEAWVKEAKDNVSVKASEVAAESLETGSELADTVNPHKPRSFREIRRLVGRAIRTKYGRERLGAPTRAGVDVPWITDIGEDRVIVRYRDQTYAIDFTINGDTVTLGDMQKAKSRWVNREGAVLLHAFHIAMGDGEKADEGDGLIWKEILHPGCWFKTNTGDSVRVTPDIVKATYKAFCDGLPKYVSVPADTHHIQTRGIVPPESNRGFVRKLKMIGDSLYAGFDIKKPETRNGVKDGSIADCSVYLQPGVVHPRSGQRYDWVLRHVLLTNNPLIQDLESFGAIPASEGEVAGAYAIENYQEEKEHQAMDDEERTDTEQYEDSEITADVLANADEITLTGEALQEYQNLLATGMSGGQLAALAAQAEAIVTQARDLEVNRVIAAMEGVGDHPSITQIEGHRHLPVVVDAVERALSVIGGSMPMDATSGGRTPFDRAIYEIVNALPATARIALEEHRGDKDPDEINLDESKNRNANEVTDEMVDQFLDEIG